MHGNIRISGRHIFQGRSPCRKGIPLSDMNGFYKITQLKRYICVISSHTLIILGIFIKEFSFPAKESPCYTNSLYLFILLNSEKNEPRSAAAVIGGLLVF